MAGPSVHEGPPKHANAVKFHHNRASKLTKLISSFPIFGLCPKCTQIIQWRKDYRKYKPLSTMKRWYVPLLSCRSIFKFPLPSLFLAFPCPPPFSHHPFPVISLLILVIFFSFIVLLVMIKLSRMLIM